MNRKEGLTMPVLVLLVAARETTDGRSRRRAAIVKADIV